MTVTSTISKLRHGLNIIGHYADVLSGAQQERAEAAIKRLMEAQHPGWDEYRQARLLEFDRRADLPCFDCGEVQTDWPIAVKPICQRCIEERRRWL